jgi:hypothetical protein
MNSFEVGILVCLFVLCGYFIVQLERKPEPIQVNTCTTEFHKYNPSPLEQKWIQNVRLWQDDVCSHITNKEIQSWLEAVSYFLKRPNQSVITSNLSIVPTADWSNVLSTFTYRHHCPLTGDIKYIHIPVEPTVGLVRDPRKVIFRF